MILSTHSYFLKERDFNTPIDQIQVWSDKLAVAQQYDLPTEQIQQTKHILGVLKGLR
ncbi:hypothetical protein N473_23845 [Pseudoalteromonas luteoviolacea CPMOR-1]|uniref:Uncharacterized protein n=1 Tax=Pseudoalteromonas luteoviolacea CPMOR-1 TaxID=1365248 RepID=A0A167J8F7_9GAMM|nr:hypothetical protein [Pseudoalteromonas luteoviolacea]KZN60764.1 hypothetical protein N473_23845 [Pseudoalteromonas luteoviolacea CPMOR-1]